MKFTEHRAEGTASFTGYGSDYVAVNGQRHETCLLIGDGVPAQAWAVQSIGAITLESLAPVLAIKPDTLILGTGQKFALPAPALYKSLREQGVGLEVMDTGAACRTYNVLLSEGRKVVAAILLS